MQNTELSTVTFHVSSQEVWGGMGRWRDRERHWVRQLQFSSFKKKNREKRRKKEKKKITCLLRGDPHLVVSVEALE